MVRFVRAPARAKPAAIGNPRVPLVTLHPELAHPYLMSDLPFWLVLLIVIPSKLAAVGNLLVNELCDLRRARPHHETPRWHHHHLGADAAFLEAVRRLERRYLCGGQRRG